MMSAAGSKQARQIGVIMLTATAEKDTVVECVEAGADDYLLKPYDSAQLLKKVRKILPEQQAAVEVVKDSATASPPMKPKKPVASVMRPKRGRS